MYICDNCGSPFTHSPLYGRPWPHQPPASYCCYGCLTWGEHRQIEKNSSDINQETDTSIPPALGIRLGISAIITAQIMIFGTAINLHNDISKYTYNIISIGLLLSSVIVMILLGNHLIINTIDSIYRMKITIETLFTITLIGAFIASLESYITNKGYIYFEVITILLIIYTIGNVLVTHLKLRAIKRISLWNKQIEYAHKVINDNMVIDVPVESIDVKDVVQVGPGETIPVDGIIADGTAYVFTGHIRGEPFPVTRTIGDNVVAGEIVYDAVIKIQSTCKGKQRQIDNIINIIEKASNNPSSLKYILDKLSEWFAPSILLISVVTFIYWIYEKNYAWYSALYNSMSVLLVACPCIVGIIAPLLQWLAINKMAENGIVVRSGDTIEKLAKVNYVVFDKTGTLTNFDRYSVNYISYVNEEKQKYILSAINYIEKKIKHPVAQMISQFKKIYDNYDINIFEIRQIPGCGIVSRLNINNENMILHIGAYRWIQSLITDRQLEILQGAKYNMKSIYILCNGDLSMIINLQEKTINYAYDALSEITSINLRTAIMTGDNEITISNLPVQKTYLGLSPVDKQQKLIELKNNGHNILYIGDGINDAAALASVDVAIAVASGVDLAIQVSDAILYNKDLRVVPWVITYSLTVVRAIRRSLLRALVYNFVGISLAACGYLHPITAILLMALSSISFIISSVYFDSDHNCLQSSNTSAERQLSNKYLYFSLIHFLSFIIQGMIISNIAKDFDELDNMIIILYHIFIGSILSYIWYKWKKIPHYLDMIFGMLTLGNFGMLLGWWYDVTISGTERCPCCVTNVSEFQFFSGMNIGMLLFCNIAMFILNRYPLQSRLHKIAMMIGGNIGMLSGMYIGMIYLPQHLTIFCHLVIEHYVSMSTGMIVGMLIGIYIIEKIILFIIRIYQMLK